MKFMRQKQRRKMILKNELVNLRIGKKQYDFHNLILDEYLKRFASKQLDKDKIKEKNNSLDLHYCLLKFDNPLLNINKSSLFYNNDFDIILGPRLYENKEKYGNKQEAGEQRVVVQYYYYTDSFWNYKAGTEHEEFDIKDYFGKKITAIGFNTLDGDNLPICAILDTSNYNIYLQSNQELSISRRDIIEPDALFFSNDRNKVPAPAHLMPYGLPQIINQPDIYEDEIIPHSFYDNAYGILYSLGLSFTKDEIDREFIIGKDIEAINNETELIIKEIENYPLGNNPLFCVMSKLYPSPRLYPVKTNYKYIVLKYKVWQDVHSGTYNNLIVTNTDTGYYYYQAFPIDKFGKSNIKIRYERGN